MSLKKKAAQGFAWDLGGTIARQGSGFIISIFLARLLEPAQFGIVGMAMVFISISQVFIDVGFSSALIQTKDTSRLTYSSVFYLNLFAGFVLTVVFYLSAPLIGAFYENQEITTLVQWLSFIFVFNSLNLVHGAILRKQLNFKTLTIRSIIASVVGGVIGVILAVLDFGVYSLVAQQLSTALVGTVLLWATVEWRPDLRFSFAEVKRLTGFSTFVFFDQFFSTLFQRLDIILIGKIFSPATLGFYTRAVSLKDQVTKYSSTSLTKVFYPVLASLQDDHEEFSRIYFKVISVISFLSFGITGVLYVLGADIIIFLFGQKWQPSVPIFEVLILSVCNYPLNSMMVNAFMSKGKSKQNFLIGIFRKSIRVIPLLIAYFYGLHAFTIAVVVVSYFLTIFNIVFLKIFVNLEISAHFKKIFEGLFPLLLLIFAFQYVPSEFVWRLALAIVYILIYVGFNKIIKTEGLDFIISNVLRLKEKLLSSL